MNDVDFKQFLETRYRTAQGSTLSPRVIGDVLSRCRRVEDALSVNLDQAARPKGVDALLDNVTASALGSSASNNAAQDCRSAVRRYAEYLAAK